MSTTKNLNPFLGAGGQEACLFAQEIFNFYFAYLQSLPGVRVNVTAFEDANISKNSKNAGGKNDTNHEHSIDFTGY